MKIRDLKALARETLLKWYGSAIIARIFRDILVCLSFGVSLAFFVLGLINAGLLQEFSKMLFPASVPSVTAAVIFFILAAAGMFFTLLLGIWTSYGYERMLLNIGRGRHASSGDILAAFKAEARPWKVLWTGIVRFVFVLAVQIIPLFVYGCAVACGYDGNTAAWNDPWRIAVFAVQLLAIVWMIYLSLGFTFAQTVIIDRPETGVIEALRISLKKVTGYRKPRLFWLMSFSFLLWFLLVEIVPLSAVWIVPYYEMTMILFYLDGQGELDQLPAYAALLKKQKEEAAAAEEKTALTAEETCPDNSAAAEPQAEEKAELQQAAQAEPQAETKTELQTEPQTVTAEAGPDVLPAPEDVFFGETGYAEEPSAEAQQELTAAKQQETPAEEMPAMPRKIDFPDIEADPVREPDESGTEV